MRLSDC